MRTIFAIIAFFILLIIPIRSRTMVALIPYYDIEYAFWERKMRISFDAICIVESNGNIRSYNSKENAIGVSQVREIMIVEINRLYMTYYKHDMAWDKEWSWRFFLMTQWVYNQEGDYERAARVHNGGGMGWYVTETNPYWEKIDSVLKMDRMIIK